MQRSDEESLGLAAAKSPLVVILLGAFLGAGGGAVRLALPRAAWADGVSTLALFVAGAMVAGGLLGLLFKLATQRSFEWYIAWRYLRDPGRKRSWATLIVGLVTTLLAVSLGGSWSAYSWLKGQPDGLLLGPTGVQRLLQGLALGFGVVGNLLLFFGVLLLFFSIFTTISIFGVYLGTGALVVVLSVMGGFEHDLHVKILGTTAHVVVTKPRLVFSDYREVSRRVASLEGVQAQAPYIESEVMLTSQSNLSGVLLKGIDPRLIGKVTDLPKYLRAEGGAGRLDNLLHPERLAKIPEARFRPMVTVPLGEPVGTGAGSGSGMSPAAGTGASADEPGDPDPKPRRKQPSILDIDVEKEIGKKIPPRPVYPGIIIGVELAKNLRLYIGDDVNVVAPLGGMSPAGPIPKSKPFRVAGIFYSGMYEYDTKFAYVTIPAAQRFLGLEDEVTGIEIKVGQLEVATPLADRIRGSLGERRFLVQDWKEMNKSLFSALKLEKMVMFFVLTFIVLVGAFSIITNLIMVVLEKTREISSLKTMGASAWSTLKIFFFAGIYIGIIGMLVGVLTGIGLCLFVAKVGLPLDPEVYYISTLPVRMNPLDIAIVALAAVTLAFLATIYPSLMAARLKPVEGLRRYEV